MGRLRYANDALKDEGILGPWEASSNIMVCINSRTSSENLIRLAHRYADNFAAEWLAVYVEPAINLK